VRLADGIFLTFWLLLGQAKSNKSSVKTPTITGNFLVAAKSPSMALRVGPPIWSEPEFSRSHKTSKWAL
jgi:hypothetical protein